MITSITSLVIWKRCEIFWKCKTFEKNKLIVCISVLDVFIYAQFVANFIFLWKKRIIKGSLPVTIVNHWSPKLKKKNHWKTIAANGWSCQEPLMVMVRIFKDHRHSIVGEKQPLPFHRLEKLTIVPVYDRPTQLICISDILIIVQFALATPV